MKQFTIPEGMRDMILGECEIKKKLQYQIESYLDKWGYKEVVTPTIEFYKTYNVGFEDIQEEDMYKFFDASGHILTLRTDMTIPIARVAATKFKDAKMPLRFRYCANVFKVHEALSGIRNEITDCGVELIGVEENCGDLEIVVTAMETLQVIKDKQVIMEIGNINFFQEACNGIGLDNKQASILADYIDKKSLKALEDYLEQLKLEEQYKAFFNKLPWLCGDYTILEEAKKYAFNSGLKKIISNLEQLNNDLNQLGYTNLIYDFGKVTNLNYYTGIIFEAFVEGVGTKVLSGGRYDNLIGKYGKELPAVGFSIKLDELLEVVEPPEKRRKCVIEYNKNYKLEVMKKAKELRERQIVELVVNNDIEQIVISEV